MRDCSENERPKFCEEASQAKISGKSHQATRKPSTEITRSKETESFQNDKEASKARVREGKQDGFRRQGKDLYAGHAQTVASKYEEKERYELRLIHGKCLS